MNEKYECLYKDMQADIARTLGLDHTEKENIESCFWIGKNYWEKLLEAIKTAGFKNDAEEIIFFREVKPCFTSVIEYFVILTEGVQFVPPIIPIPEALIGKAREEIWEKSNQKAIQDYWENEGKRYKRFCSKHEEFINYIESEKRYNDQLYFLRANDSYRDLIKTSLYDNETEFATYHSNLLRGYLANKKYWEYCNAKLKDPSLHSR